MGRASKLNKVPALWTEVKKRGPVTVRAMVMLAIIFSHHTLIEEMIEGAGGPGQGIIRRNRFTREKSFTNLKNDFEELGFASFLNRDEVGFDLRPILLDDKLGGLAMELFRLKLKDANWVGEDVVECALESQFNKALGIQPEELPVAWAADSKHVFAQALTPTGLNIYKIDVESGHRELWQALIPKDQVGLRPLAIPASITPDGRWIAFNYRTVLGHIYRSDTLK